MNKKILVLDDDNDILNILTYVLEDQGYEVNTLSTGEKVLEEIRSFHPDLVLMDVMLAGMDGRKICKSLKSQPETNSLPVILISGTHDLAESLHEQGAPNDFLAKPFDIDRLVEKVSHQLQV